MKQSESNAFPQWHICFIDCGGGDSLRSADLPRLFSWASHSIFALRREAWGYCVNVPTHACSCTQTLLPLSLSLLSWLWKKMQACCSPKKKTNLRKVYWLCCSRVILTPKTKNEKKRNIFSWERSLGSESRPRLAVSTWHCLNGVTLDEIFPLLKLWFL